MGVKMPKRTKPQRPSLDEFELEELANTVNESYREKSKVLLNIWQKEPICGQIVKLDGQTQMVHINSGIDTMKVKFRDILKIESAPQ